MKHCFISKTIQDTAIVTLLVDFLLDPINLV